MTYVTPYVGNTESVGLEIQKQVGGDLFLIETEKSYPTNHREASQIAEEEKNNDERPVLSTHLDNIDDYDIVFIGYPIWWYEEPMVIYSFIEEYDLQDKTVIPFCTSLGVSITESENNLRTVLPESNVLTGLSIRTESEDIELTVQDWLKEIGVISNEDNI